MDVRCPPHTLQILFEWFTLHGSCGSVVRLHLTAFIWLKTWKSYSCKSHQGLITRITNYLRGFIDVKLEAMTRIYFLQGLRANLRTNKNEGMAWSIQHHPWAPTKQRRDQALKTITKGAKSGIKTQSRFVPLEEQKNQTIAKAVVDITHTLLISSCEEILEVSTFNQYRMVMLIFICQINMINKGLCILPKH